MSQINLNKLTKLKYCLNVFFVKSNVDMNKILSKRCGVASNSLIMDILEYSSELMLVCYAKYKKIHL
jgi:hypothetical protein